MNPTTLLMAHEEMDADGKGGVRPVASDLDAFLIGSKGMAFNDPLPPEQLRLIEWCIDGVEKVLATPGSQGWTKRWFEVLKAGFGDKEMP